MTSPKGKTKTKTKKKKSPVMLRDLAPPSSSPLEPESAPAASPQTAPRRHAEASNAYGFISHGYQSPLQQRLSRLERRFPFVGRFVDTALNGWNQVAAQVADSAEDWTQEAIRLARKRLPAPAWEALTRLEQTVETFLAKAAPFLRRAGTRR